MNNKSIIVEDLIDLLKRVSSDFEVLISTFNADQSEFQTFKIVGLTDISFSEKTIMLEAEEI